MTPRTIGRRRLLAGGAAAGFVVLTACEDPGAVTRTPGLHPTRRRRAPRHPRPRPRRARPRHPGRLRRARTSTPPDTVTPVDAPRLAERLDEYLDGRSGTLGLQLIDLRRAESFDYGAKEGYCYSTIKVLVLTTLLRRLQDDGAALKGRQRRLAERMITRSDNAATEELLAEVGRDEVRRVADLVGMDDTEMDDGWWGLWRTVPGDLNRMVGAVLSSDAVLDGSRRTLARFLMADVVPEQRWGVFAPESKRVHVAAKNGWGPLPDGYRLNSAGWVSADDREYQVAIMSNSPAGFRHGRRTVSEVAEICHRAVGQGLA